MQASAIMMMLDEDGRGSGIYFMWVFCYMPCGHIHTHAQGEILAVMQRWDMESLIKNTLIL